MLQQSVVRNAVANHGSFLSAPDAPEGTPAAFRDLIKLEVRVEPATQGRFEPWLFCGPTPPGVMTCLGSHAGRSQEIKTVRRQDAQGEVKRRWTRLLTYNGRSDGEHTYEGNRIVRGY